MAKRRKKAKVEFVPDPTPPSEPVEVVPTEPLAPLVEPVEPVPGCEHVYQLVGAKRVDGIKLDLSRCTLCGDEKLG